MTKSAVGFIGVVLLLGACGARTETELTRASSPDKQIVALLVQVDPGGGATVGFTNYVYLAQAGQAAGKTAQFAGYSCGPMHIEWKESRTLQVTYQPHCHITQFNNEWWTGSDASTAQMVELVLKREDGQGG
jgi:hypothetical protein